LTIRLFPVDGKPVAVVLMGRVAAGKTTMRKQRFSTGYVLVDAADIFLSLSRGEVLPFPAPLQEPVGLIGRLVAKRALSERRNESRGGDDISAYYAEPFQRAWIIDACNELVRRRKA
jgi:hypothetical protein